MPVRAVVFYKTLALPAGALLPDSLEARVCRPFYPSPTRPTRLSGSAEFVAESLPEPIRHTTAASAKDPGH
jgi:hypothetical protein